MAIDSSIALQVKPLQIDSPINAFAQFSQLQQAQQQNALGRMKMDEYQRGVKEQDQIRSALMGLGGSATDEQRISALKGTGLPGGFSQADALEKALLERQKTGAEAGYKAAQTGELKQKTDHEKIRFALQGLATANDPTAAAKVALNAGLVPPEKAQEYLASIPKDPAGYQQWRQQQMMSGVELDKQFTIQATAARDKETQDNNVRVDGRIRSEGAANRGVTMRGQNLTDARSRESTAATLTKPFEITGPDGKPVLVQQDKQGNIKPVEGYAPKTGADKPMTDAQAKAALFGSRMESSNKILETLAESGTDTSVPFSRAPIVGGAITAVSSAKKQQLDQAKRDFINATLRRESGAVISDSEFDNGDKQYFPQVGDSKEVKAQKAANRAIAVRGVQAEVPKGNRGVLDEIQGKVPTFDSEKERRYQEWKAKQK